MTKKIAPGAGLLWDENHMLKTQLAQLESQLELVGHLVDNSDLMAWIVNTDLEFIYLSPAFINRYYGFTGTRFALGQKVSDVFPENYQTIWDERFKRALAGESFRVEEKIGLPEDNKYFSLSVSPLQKDGLIKGVQVYINETTGLKKAEQNEITSLKKLKGIFTQIQDLYYEVDLDGKITELSPAIKNFSSYNRDDLIGKDVVLLYKNKADRETFLTNIKKNGAVKEHVIEVADKDGSTKSISVSATLVFNEEHQPEKIVGIIRDVTETEKNNNDLRWLRRAIEQCPVSIVITDIEGSIQYTNPFFTKSTQYSKEEVWGKNPSLLKSGQQTVSFYKDMWDAIRSGETWEGEFQNRRKDGSLFTERAIISPVKDDDGRIINFIAVKEDVTETKMAHDEIRHLKSFNERIIQTMQEGIVVENAEGKVLFTNPSFAAMTGYSIEELTGRRWQKMIETSSFVEQQNTESPIFSKSLEMQLICKDGNAVPVLMSSSPIQDGRKYMGLISVFTDITQIKENEKKLTEALEKAQLSDKLKSSFLANVSHEIRTPMNAILGFSEILRNEKNLDDAVREEYFSIIELKGTELLQVISDVIDVSKIEARMMVLNTSDTVINPLINKIFNTFREELNLHRKHLVKLTKIIPPNTDDVTVKIDTVRFNQVFSNLLHNARKFTAEGEISIGYSIHDNYIEFFVKDTGIGISPENQKIIFDRFRQADHEYKREYEGTGLGLNICKSLLLLMGGDIRVESLESKGSGFFFSLPR